MKNPVTAAMRALRSIFSRSSSHTPAKVKDTDSASGEMKESAPAILSADGGLNQEAERPNFRTELANGGKIGLTLATLVGFVGDLMEPLAAFNFYLLLGALVAVPFCATCLGFLAEEERVNWKRLFPHQLLVFSCYSLICLFVWYGLGLLAGEKDRGAIASNLPFVAKLQESILGLQESVEELHKDTTQLKKDSAEIKEKTSAIKDDTAAIKQDSKAIKTATESTAKTVKNVDRTLSTIAKEVQGIGKLGDLIADPTTKFDFLHNANAYHKRNNHSSARDSYLKYFDLETADFVDSYSGYWELLNSEFAGEPQAKSLFQQLLKSRPDSLAGNMILLAADPSDEASARILSLYQSHPDFLPVFPLLATRMPSKTLYDLQRIAEVRQAYLKKGGFATARKFLLRPDDGNSPWVAILKRFGEGKSFDVSRFVSVNTFGDENIQLLEIQIRDTLPPRSMSLRFPNGKVVTVPMGAANPAGADSLSLIFELSRGQEGRFRFDPRSPNDRRIYQHCGTLYGLSTKPVDVTLAIVDSKGRPFTFPTPLPLGYPNFSIEVVAPEFFARVKLPKLQITPAQYLSACSISLNKEGPYIPVAEHMNVPTLREIPLEYITGLPLKPGRYSIWVKGTTDRGTQLEPELLTLELPPGLPGLTGKLAPGRPTPPKSKADYQWKFEATSVLTLSADGRWLAAVGNASNRNYAAVTVVDTNDGTLVKTLDFGRGVTTVAFSPDGKWLAAASSRERGRILDNTSQEVVVTILNVSTGAKTELKSRPDPTFVLAFSPDGKRLAAGQRDPQRKSLVRLWELSSGEETTTLTGLSAQQITCLAFSRDGRLLAASNGKSYGNGNIGIWEFPSDKRKESFRGEPQGSDQLLFSPDSELLLVSSAGHNLPSVRLWDLQTGEDLAAQFSTRGESALAFAANDTPIMARVNERTASVWNVKTGNKILEVLHRGRPSVGPSIWKIALSPDGKRLYAGGNIIRVWNIK